MGTAFSRASETAGRGGKAVFGAALGAVAGAAGGAMLGKNMCIKDMSELVLDASRNLVYKGASVKDLKSEQMKELQMVTNDTSTAICAALSSWSYMPDGRALKITKADYCYLFSLDQLLKNDDENKLFLPEETQPCRVLAEGEVETEGTSKKWVQIEVLGGTDAFLWLGDHEFLQNPKVDILSAVKTRLNKECGLVERADIKRAVYGCGGVLSPSVLSVMICDSTTRENTLYMVWQGTMSDKRPLDLIIDLAAAPVRAGLWDTVYPYLWVHSGFHAKVQNDFCAHKNTILKLIKNYAVTRLVFTGHSLGGALARVAHVGALAEFAKMSDEAKQQLSQVDIQSITFAAPMVFFKPDMRVWEQRKSGDDIVTKDSWLMEAEAQYRAKCTDGKDAGFEPKHAEKAWDDLERVGLEEQKQVEAELKNNSVNHLFDKDVVPQLPGRPKFFQLALKMAARSAVADHVKSWTDKIPETVDLVCDKALDINALQKSFKELERFSHLCKLCHYKACPDSGSITHEEVESECSMPEWQDDPGDTWQYLLTCHSVLPRNISFSSAEPSHLHSLHSDTNPTVDTLCRGIGDLKLS